LHATKSCCGAAQRSIIAHTWQQRKVRNQLHSQTATPPGTEDTVPTEPTAAETQRRSGGFGEEQI